MSVFHSCGHEDRYRPVSGWPLAVKAETCTVDGFTKCVEYSTVCRDCYIKWVTKYPEDIIFDPWEVDEYFEED